MAAAGRALLGDACEAAIGFLATASNAGSPHLAPVCPIFCDDWLYLSVGADSPKRRDLDANGRYVLHAFLGPDDAEFKVFGIAEAVVDDAARRHVQAAIRFGAFRQADPIYRLWMATCMYGYWASVGRPDTRPVRRWWHATRP